MSGLDFKKTHLAAQKQPSCVVVLRNRYNLKPLQVLLFHPVAEVAPHNIRIGVAPVRIRSEVFPEQVAQHRLDLHQVTWPMGQDIVQHHRHPPLDCFIGRGAVEDLGDDGFRQTVLTQVNQLHVGRTFQTREFTVRFVKYEHIKSVFRCSYGFTAPLEVVRELVVARNGHNKSPTHAICVCLGKAADKQADDQKTPKDQRHTHPVW